MWVVFGYFAISAATALFFLVTKFNETDLDKWFQVRESILNVIIMFLLTNHYYSFFELIYAVGVTVVVVGSCILLHCVFREYTDLMKIRSLADLRERVAEELSNSIKNSQNEGPRWFNVEVEWARAEAVEFLQSRK